MKRGKIGVWGHYHGGNIGDDIVVSTLIANIRRRLPCHEVYGFSLRPEDTAQRHGVPSYSIKGGPLHRPPGAKVGRAASTQNSDTPTVRQQDALVGNVVRPRFWHRKTPVIYHFFQGLRLLRRVLRFVSRMPEIAYQNLQIWRVLRGFDAIVVAGSGPIFDDMGGVWVHPYNLLRWTVLSRLAGSRVLLLSVGAGPINGALSRYFLSVAMRLASYRSFRDESSLQLARALGVPEPNYRFPDMAFGVEDVDLADARDKRLTSVRPIVGLTTMAYMEPGYWPKADGTVYASYLAALGELSLWLLNQGYDIVLLKSQRFADQRVADALMALLKEKSGILADNRVMDLPTRGHHDLLRQIAGCEVVIGGRFHCHILPFILGKPVLGVSYHPKTEELMRQMGQEGNFLRMNLVSGQMLIDRFKKLVDSKSETEESIRAIATELREDVATQFDRVFQLNWQGGSAK